MKLTCNLDYSPSSVWLTPAAKMEHSSLPFYAQELGNTIANANYYVYREGLESYFIGYVYGGEGVLEWNGYSTKLEPGCAIWLDCMQPHAYYTAKGGKRFECMFVHFYGGSVQEFHHFFSNLCPNGCLRIHPGSEIPDCLNKLIELYRQEASDLRADFHASALLSLLCSAMIDSACRQAESSVPAFVASMRTYLEQSYSEHVDLETLSQRYFLSKSYLQKQFKKYTGLSPADYLTRVRISQAKQQLRTTELSIHEVGCSVGIPDPSYFVCIFKKAEGVTPAVFRKSWRPG
jgi:AraC family transcriptional regulator of arabinose operon